jgi:hypothetical protein
MDGRSWIALLFLGAGALQAMPWCWYAGRAWRAGLPLWVVAACLVTGFVLLACSVWVVRQPHPSTAVRLVAFYGLSCAIVSVASLLLGNALVELTSGVSLALAYLGSRWLRWHPLERGIR